MNGANNGGWIKLHRRLLKSTVWQNHNLTRFWTWCLLQASYQDITVKAGSADVQLQPGQFLYSHADASIQTGLSQRVVRSCVETLGKEMGIVLGREKGRKKSILTILNWESYQGGDSGEGRKTDKQKGKETGTLYYKVDKKIKEIRLKNEVIDVTWNGEKLDIPDVFMEKYRTKFPRLDIPSVIVDIERWLLKNSTKAASYKSFDSFLNNWLRREEEKQRKQNPDDAPYELTGDSLAAAIECANLFGKRAING